MGITSSSNKARQDHLLSSSNQSNSNDTNLPPTLRPIPTKQRESLASRRASTVKNTCSGSLTNSPTLSRRSLQPPKLDVVNILDSNPSPLPGAHLFFENTLQLPLWLRQFTNIPPSNLPLLFNNAFQSIQQAQHHRVHSSTQDFLGQQSTNTKKNRYPGFDLQ